MVRTCAYCGHRDAFSVDADDHAICRPCASEVAGLPLQIRAVELAAARARIVRAIRMNPGSPPHALAEILEIDTTGHGQPLRRIRQTAASEVRARRLVPHGQGWRAP